MKKGLQLPKQDMEDNELTQEQREDFKNELKSLFDKWRRFIELTRNVNE